MSDPANLGIYKKILIALLFATVVTVALALPWANMGTAGNIIVGLIIAVAKATLVVLFFMHLKYEQRWWAGLVIFPLILVMIIIFSNMPDTALNQGEAFGSGQTTPAKKVTPGTGAGAAH